ncbi:MAG: alpha/beta hydrolase [Clostridia bacterium]|nr:alpha/beta hydrolase [Clostridia bacterium]
MNPEQEQRGRYKPDYTGMTLRVYDYCQMKDFEDKEQIYSLDFIVKDDDARTDRPAVIFVHGGGFLMPNDRRQAYISLFARDLTNAGYAVVSPDYPQFATEEALEQAGGEEAAYEKAGEAVHRAYEYLNHHADALGVDPARIHIMGGSAGAMAAFYAIGNHQDAYRAFINCWGAPLTLPDMRAFPPTLSIHGDSDQLVSYDRELPVQDSLEKANVLHRLITLPGQPHTPLGKYREFLPDILEWLQQGEES